MARHRDVRNMDYSDDYDGYDDIYGHSVDDDDYVSPSHRQFLYNRENSGQSRSGDAYPMEQDIQEECEEELRLAEPERAQLEYCLDHVRSITSRIDMPRQEVVRIILDHNFDTAEILTTLLTSRRKGDTILRNHSVLLNGLRKQHANLNTVNALPSTLPSSRHAIPKCSSNFLNKININTQQAAPLKSNVNSFNSNNDIEDDGMDTVDAGSVISSNMRNIDRDTINVSPSVSFLSKIKTEGDKLGMNQEKQSRTSILSGLRSRNVIIDPTKPTASTQIKFLANMPTCKYLQSTQGDTNSRTVSFLSKIKNPVDLNLDSEGSSVDSLSSEHSPRLCLLSNINNHVEIENLKSEKKPKDFSINFAKICGKNGVKAVPNLKSSSLNSLRNENIKSEKLSKDFSINFAKHLNLANEISGNNGLKIFPNLKSSLNSLGGRKSEVLPRDISERLSRLDLSKVNSVPAIQHDARKNNLSIDLTTAVRTNKYKTFKPKMNASEEKFELPFVACDQDLQVNSSGKGMLRCTLDISHLAFEKVLYETKRSSPLGRVLCSKYRIPEFKKCRKKNTGVIKNLVCFNFLTESPDDKILKHIRRNL